MKSLVGSIVLLLLMVPMLALGADLGVYGTTLLTFEERKIPGFDSQQIIPATQFLGLDADKIGDPNLSMHLYGWGRVDLADRSTDKSSDANFTYGYLRYLFPKANGEIKAGRLFLFEGVSIENVDGVRARVDLAKGFTLSVYGGIPVRPDRTNDNSGDFITGGRASYRYPSILELGVSAVYETGMTNGPITDLKDYRQLVGGDLWFRPHKTVELTGRTSYNTVTGGFAENSYLLTIKPLPPLTITGDYNQYRFKDYYSDTNIRSLFNPNNNGDIKYYGGSVTYVIAKPIEVTASYRHYDREYTGNSNRFGGELRYTPLEGKVKTGLSYYRVDAPSAVNSYDEIRGYVMYNGAKFMASIDAISDFYDNNVNIYGKKTAFEIQGSTGYRLLPYLTLSGDISYSENPQYKDEVKGLLRLTVNYSTSKGAGK
jgi:hypothetical protein